MTKKEYNRKRWEVFSEIHQEFTTVERCDICGCNLSPHNKGIYCSACAKEQAKIKKEEKKEQEIQKQLEKIYCSPYAAKFMRKYR